MVIILNSKLKHKNSINVNLNNKKNYKQRSKVNLTFIRFQYIINRSCNVF